MSLLKTLVRNQKVVSLPPSSTIFQAAQTMEANRVGSVVVMEQDKLMGIFTERDLLNRVVAKEVDIRKTTLAEVMSCTVETISLADSAQSAFQKMEKTRCRRLPIVEGDKIVGMVTMRDILEWINKEMEDENVQMKRYIQS